MNYFKTLLANLITATLAVTGAILAFAPSVISFVPAKDAPTVSAILTICAAIHGTLAASPVKPTTTTSTVSVTTVTPIPEVPKV